MSYYREPRHVIHNEPFTGSLDIPEFVPIAMRPRPDEHDQPARTEAGGRRKPDPLEWWPVDDAPMTTRQAQDLAAKAANDP